MVIDFAKLPNPAKERPTLVLRNLSGNAIQPLGYAFNIKAELAYNEVSTLNFDLPAYVDGVPVPNYDEVIGMRQVDLIGTDGAPCASFLLVDPQEKYDGVRKVKSCKAYSLEYEFAKKEFFLDAGTYNFHTLGDEMTIVKLVLSEVPGWTIGSISPTLIGRYRTFDEQKCKVYDFIKNQAQEKYGCVFEFNPVNRTVDIIDVMEDRSATDKRKIFLSPERLIKEIDINEDSDKIVTALDVSGADGVTIRSVNPTGTNVIYNLDYFMNETNFPGGNEPDGIITTWNEWKAAVADRQSDYYDITIQYNMKLLQVMMKQAELDELNIDLLVLENERAVIVQGIQQKLKKQSDLNDVNARLSAKAAEVTAKQAEVNAMQAVADALHIELIDINEELAFEEWFTPAEITALRRYFIEDSIQDGTFVAETAKVYVNEDTHSAVTNQSLSISGSAISDPATQGNHTVYSCRGGELTFNNLHGYIVAANIDDDANGDTVLTAYLRGGTIGSGADSAMYDSATITIAGTAGTITASGTALSFTVTSGDFYFTENTTEYEVHQIEYELYEYGTLVLQRKCNPTYNFTVNSGNFLIVDDFVSFKNQLELGRKVYLQLEKDDTPLQPYVLGVTMDYEDFGSFTIKFSSAYTSFDNSFDLADLLSQSVSMGKTLSTKGNSYELFVASGASTKVHDFMTSALDIATNSVMSTGMQAISMDDAGLRIRKWTDSSHEAYDPHQIWIVDNVMAFTKDGWNTSEMALGEIFDENLLSYIPTEDSSQVQGKTYYTDDQGTVWDGTTPWSTSLYERSYGYTITTDMSRDTSKTYYVRDEATGTFSVWNPSGSIPWSQNLYEKSLGATAYGICAPYIVGTMIAGNNLVIESEKKDGGTSVFRVDGNGASLYNANFKVKNGTSEIVIDPELGFGIGKATASESIISNGGWDETKTTLWVDTSGNLHVKGTGEFSGALHVGAISGTSPQAYHFNVNDNGYLTIKNDSGTTQLSADNNGNLKFAGALDAASGTFKGAIQVGQIGTTSNYRFQVDSSGNLTIRNNSGDTQFSVDNSGNATFSGTVSGNTFSGITINGGTLNIGPYTYNNTTYYHFKVLSTGEFSIGTNATIGTTPYARYAYFSVTTDGKLTAHDATIDGTISSSTIKASTLSSTNGGVTLSGYFSVQGTGETYYLGIVPGNSNGFGFYTVTSVGNSSMYTSFVRTVSYGAEIGGGDSTGHLAAKVYGTCSNSSPMAAFQVTAQVGSSYYTRIVQFENNSAEGGWTFRPNVSDGVELGSSNHRWSSVWCADSALNGSDRNEKTDISYDNDAYLKVFDALRPVSYKRINGTSGRTHFGFIAQDVEEAIVSSGMTTQDYACIAKYKKENSDEYGYALRYGEFVALNTLKIKQLEARIDTLEAQLAQRTKG